MDAVKTECPEGTRECVLTIAGEQVTLLPQRAVAWGRTLLVADMHFGKVEALHALGVGVPIAVMDEQLARLGAAAAACAAERIIVLGDLLHAPTGTTPSMIARFGEWRRAFAGEIVLVTGNHDRRLEVLGDSWGLTFAGPRLDGGPFTFVHDPRPIAGRYVWGGHLHPAVTLRSGGDALKFACFHLSAGVGVLPAFCLFTAGGSIPRSRRDRAFVVADGGVHELGAGGTGRGDPC